MPKGEIIGQLALLGWLVVASVLALMSKFMLVDVLGSWHCLTVGKSIGIDVNQTSMDVCGRKY